MKKLLKITSVFLLSIMLFSCSKEQQNEQVSLVDNSEKIKNLISSFDATFKQSISNPKLNNNELGDIFINDARNRGLKIIKLEENQNLAKKANATFSNEYKNFSIKISQTGNYTKKDDYTNDIANLRKEIILSNIPIEEKQLLIDNINLMTSITDWMSTLKSPYASKSSIACEEGWWKCWGQCVAGAFGGAVSGAFGGCITAGGLGAFIGLEIGGIPGLFAGFVGGCLVGEIVGGVTGGLLGAAASC